MNNLRKKILIFTLKNKYFNFVDYNKDYFKLDVENYTCESFLSSLIQLEADGLIVYESYYSLTKTGKLVAKLLNNRPSSYSEET